MNPKTVLIILLSAVLPAACGRPTAVQYTVTGRDTSFADGKYMYILTYTDDAEIVIDSALIRNSSFTIRGSWHYPTEAYLYMGKGWDGVQIGDGAFFVEEGTVRTQRQGDSFRFAGTPQNDLQIELQDRQAELSQKLGSGLRYTAAMDSLLLETARRNRNALGLLLLNDLLLRHSGEELQPLLDAYPETYRAHPALLDLHRKLANLPGDIGKPFVDISGTAPQGDTLSLSEVVRHPENRYVLLDFGALWCFPCRMDYPHLAKTYRLYRDRGFEIFGVSFDIDRKRWLEAIATYGMTWPQVGAGFGLPPRETNAWKAYSLEGIPANYLIDCRTGRIVAKNLRAEAIGETVASLFGEKPDAGSASAEQGGPRE